MTYADYYLRFPDETTAATVLGDADAPRYQYVDTIGTMYVDATDPPPEGDAPAEPPTPYDGWHVNVRAIVGTDDVAPLLPYAITPTHPRRTWSGGMSPALLEPLP